jgi:hypothetical protein
MAQRRARPRPPARLQPSMMQGRLPVHVVTKRSGGAVEELANQT